MYPLCHHENLRSVIKSHVALASASAAAGGSYLFWVLIAPHLDESTSMFRYSIPVLIGVSSAALPLCATISARRGTTVSIIVGALVALLFVSSTGERVTRLYITEQHLLICIFGLPRALTRHAILCDRCSTATARLRFGTSRK